jgi:hypothetical protein
MKTPVALLIFKRPETTEKILEVLRQVKPSKLLVFADGPRANQPDEVEKCNATRSIIERVDWDCEVLKYYSEDNLGCGLGPATGINWVFEQVEEAIILEDDCLPHPTFFRFCDELLDKYRDDKRIMMISGFNILGEWKSKDQDYHFSYFGAIWGWASWRRAWQHFDFDAKLWSDVNVKQGIKNLLGDELLYHYRAETFDQIYKLRNHQNSGFDIWDYQWDLSMLVQSGISITPSVNLISNIGFTKDATHTKQAVSGIADLPVLPMSFPLRQPLGVLVDTEYDRRRARKRFKVPSRKFLLKSTFRQIKELITKNLKYINLEN